MMMIIFAISLPDRNGSHTQSKNATGQYKMELSKMTMGGTVTKH